VIVKNVIKQLGCTVPKPTNYDPTTYSPSIDP
jgi:hypothetical protein